MRRHRRLFEFISKQLGVPAKTWNGGARTAAFSTEDGAGLFRIEFLTGRSGKEPPAKDEKQEGLDAANPVRLSAEWSFLVRTRLPLGKPNTAVDPSPRSPGEVDLRSVPAPRATGSIVHRRSRWRPQNCGRQAELARRLFPGRQLGDPVPEAQVAGVTRSSKLKTGQPSIALVEGMIVDYGPTIPNATPLTRANR